MYSNNVKFNYYYALEVESIAYTIMGMNSCNQFSKDMIQP